MTMPTLYMLRGSSSSIRAREEIEAADLTVFWQPVSESPKIDVHAYTGITRFPCLITVGGRAYHGLEGVRRWLRETRL